MSDSHWEPALEAITDSSSGVYGPKSFVDYLSETGENPDTYRTAAEISVDTKRDLASRLREADMMVLRLGSAPRGTGTQFALVESPGHLDDFFINEREGSIEDPTTLDFSSEGADISSLSQTARDMLELYRLLPNFSESTLVNLAFSTGLVSRALDLDVEQIGTAPTTIASTFDFSFRPHRRFERTVEHNNRQVEVDACVVTRRAGERVMLVIEAKTGRHRDLAKHKLFYPYLAMAEVADAVDRVVPVYLHARSTENGFEYDIHECTVPETGDGVGCLSDFTVSYSRGYEVVI